MDDTFVLVDERDLGTSKTVDDLEAGFLMSCEHNNVSPENLQYFRQYVWNLMAMMLLKLKETK